MSHARTQHPNAVLTPNGRRRMIDCVLRRGWTITATAQRFQVDAKTVRKWRDRFVVEGPAGLLDRSSRPHRSPTKTSPRGRREVLRLRRKRRWGADHIAHEVGLAASTVHNILNGAGLGRLDVGDRATDREPVRRYQRERPGELIHIDVKKLSGIPDGGGWRIHGRGQAPTVTRSSVGYRFIHSAVDDRTRLAYSEILDDEQAATAAGFWHRAHAFFAADVNGTYLLKGTHSGQWALRVSADIDASLTAASRPPRDTGYPQWAYIRPWTSETQRATYYRGFLHFYNHHRSHGALSWATPIDTLTRLAEDSLPEEHT